LRALGVRIALDDFGTGYSSLSYLRSFPFDKIKIDRSFVTPIAADASAAAIVRAIVDLAGAFHMETTAEGVEDAEQLAALRGQGCNSIQGYLFSRPLTVDGVHRLLRDKSDEFTGSRLVDPVDQTFPEKKHLAESSSGREMPIRRAL
jgi:EAL domain-containing protein (putative c-di-GMP-specific phosphodiesterase class I)